MKRQAIGSRTHTGGGLRKQPVGSNGQFVDTGKSEYTTIKKSELAQLRGKSNAPQKAKRHATRRK